MSGLSQSTALKASALIGALGVALGAFGAHGLEELLIENGRVDTWETAAFYHLVHAVVLLVLATRERWLAGPWLALAAGVLIFSGSLYLLSLSNIGWLGAITPLGGLGLLAGWIWIGFGVKA
ncbi:MAG: DUF423 domain-containing protein [Puniceicoccaceae bacterium]